MYKVSKGIPHDIISLKSVAFKSCLLHTKPGGVFEGCHLHTRLSGLMAYFQFFGFPASYVSTDNRWYLGTGRTFLRQLYVEAHGLCRFNRKKIFYIYVTVFAVRDDICYTQLTPWLTCVNISFISATFLVLHFFMFKHCVIHNIFKTTLVGVNITAPQQRFPFTCAFEVDEVKTDKSF